MKKTPLFLLPICIFSLCFATFSVTLSTGCGETAKTTQPEEFAAPTAEEPKIGGRKTGGANSK